MLKKLAANISPSILSCDFAMLLEECNRMVQAGADSLHIDVMDGHFVPNLTLGAPIIKCLRKHLKNVFFDCHLMVTRPTDFIEPFAQAGANGFTFHYESEYADIKQVCEAIRTKNMKVGLAIKPNTPLDQTIRQLIRESFVDMILIMTVEPGFGGQLFNQDVMPKVKSLREQFPSLDIEVDGGITEKTIKIVSENGANVIVSGTTIFGSQDPKNTIQGLRDEVNKHLPA